MRRCSFLPFLEVRCEGNDDVAQWQTPARQVPLGRGSARANGSMARSRVRDVSIRLLRENECVMTGLIECVRRTQH